MDFTPFTPGAPLTPAAPLDVAVPPGETLREALDDLHMSQVELASRIGASAKHVNQIIKGLVPISADIAQRLDSVTGIPARLWTRLESDYQTSKAEQARDASLSAAIDWMRDAPVRALVKAGVLPDGKFDSKQRLDQMLRFFGIADIDAFESVVPAAAFRRSTAHRQNQFAVAAWLRLGELAARELDIADYNARALRASLPDLRALTELEPATAMSRLTEIAGAAGVGIVFQPEVTGARAFGATFWVSPRRPVVMLSARGGTLDKFWETVFHEIGHVLLHDRKRVFIEDEDDDDTRLEEMQAIKFSQDLLLPADAVDQLASLHTEDEVSAFAERIGVQSGIVLAELQRRGLWSFEQGNSRLRRKLTAADLPSTDTARIKLARPDRLRWGSV